MSMHYWLEICGSEEMIAHANLRMIKLTSKFANESFRPYNELQLSGFDKFIIAIENHYHEAFPA